MPDSTFSIKKVIEAHGSTAAALAVEASAADDPALLDALLGGALPSGDLELGRILLQGEAGKSVVLGSGKAKAEFSASAGAHGRFGVYASGTDVLEALGLDAAPIGGLQLPAANGQRFGVLDWGYQASVGGGVALQGKAAPRIEGEAQRRARYIVLRLQDADLPGRDFLANTLGSLILPAQVVSAASLAPGTWVIAEVDGSLGIKVGAQYGFSVDWVREAALGGLTGDIGLKIKAGIDVALGFAVAGRYRVAVSRPHPASSVKTIRVQVFKMKRKGWDFALNAGATVEPVASILPETFDQFLGGVFGIDGTQLLEDLAEIRSLTDPGAALEALLGDSEGVLGFLEELVPGAATLVDRYEQAWTRLAGFLTRWEELDHDVAALLWAKVGHEAEIDEIRSFAERLSDLDPDGIRERILERIEGSALGSDAVLQWLSSVLDGDLLSGLARTRTLTLVQQAAATTATVLDPALLGTVLGALHELIGETLHVDRIREAVAAGSVERLDTWLTTRLESFLGQAIDATRLEELGKVIELLEAKGPEFFARAKEALSRKYEVAFALAYRNSTERTALVDVEIDGAHPDAPGLLKQAISGELGRFLLKDHPAVALRTGTLTHGIERETSVSVSLPMFDSDFRTFTRSLARVDVADEPGGRVALYSVAAENTVERDNSRRSRLTLSGTLHVSSNRVRQWTAPEWLSTYEYVETIKNARRAVLEHRLEPLIETYFADDFPVNASRAIGSVSTWMDDFDRTIATLSANGSDNFGNTLLRLSVALPAAVSAAWAKAPGQKLAPPYLAMSLAMQATMRRVMLRVADARPGFYKKRSEAAALLVYAALPPAHGASIKRTGDVNLRGKSAIHWNWHQRKLMKALLNHRQTHVNLAATFASVHRRLARGGEVSSTVVARYEPTAPRIKDVLETAFVPVSTGLTDLEKLLFVEEEAIEAAREAGQAMARFHRSANVDAAEGVAALADFGAKATEAFNSELRPRYGDTALPALSGELYAAAARAFDPSVMKSKNLAMLEVVTFREGAPFPPDELTELSAREDVLLAQRFVRG